MNKVLISLMFFTIFSFRVQAQLSDIDAKLQYQQAEDAYNNNEYLKALTTLRDLTDKMGNEPPKVVYLLLKTYAKSLDIGTSNKNYNDLDYYSSIATRFTEKINSPSFDYPLEKASEIKEIQSKLLLLKTQYSSQKDRTALDAVNFLNDIIKSNDGKMSKKTHFTLVDHFLKITILEESTYNSKACVDIYDLTECEAFTSQSGENTFSIPYYSKCIELIYGIRYRGGSEKKYRQDMRNEINTLIGIVPAETSIKNFKKIENTGHESNTQFQNRFFYYLNVPIENYTSSAYLNSRKRIQDAFLFLLNYFPKKTNNSNELPINKF